MQVIPEKNFTVIPYASQVFFEIYKSEKYYVKLTYNGQVLKLAGCSNMEGYPDGGCEINEFLVAINKNLYLDDQYINEKCKKVPTE